MSTVESDSVKQVRERIIPLAKKFPIESLQHALHQINELQTRPVMIEYLLLAGVNDSLDDAQLLVEWLANLRAHVNLIPYNAIADAPHLIGTERTEREAFGAFLKQAGIPTTIRYSLGGDIAAACGQLVRKENRAVAITQTSGFSQRK